MVEKSRKTGRVRLGKWGENIACQFLVARGFECLEKNYRTPDGEIDLIVKKDSEIVFVEVKTRRNLDHGTPEESITDEKLEHIESSVGWYLDEHHLPDDNWRADVISVVGVPGGAEPRIEWFTDVH